MTLNLVKEKYRADQLKKGILEKIEGEHSLSEDDVRRVISALGKLKPHQSPRPILGPILTWVRQCLWRLIGVEPTCHEVTSILSEILEPPLVFREGIYDQGIWLSVFNHNEYRLPESFKAEDIIIDIGMHIGSFAYAALARGCGSLYGFEPDSANFSLAVQNLKRFGNRAHLSQKAVWRSDRSGDALFHNGYPEGNTGGGCVLHDSGSEKLDLIAFDEVLREVTDNGRKRIRLVKIDCEGSEFPILLTSRLLHLIDNIHGEYHLAAVKEVARVDGVKEHTIEALTEHLKAAGFSVKSFPFPNSHLGLFFAKGEGAQGTS